VAEGFSGIFDHSTIAVPLWRAYPRNEQIKVLIPGPVNQSLPTHMTHIFVESVVKF